ncbi:Uncharacterized protein FKW44_024703, partial [Caligus rogercresseyi]
SIRAHAAKVGVPHSTLALAVKNSGGKSLVRLERPILTPAMKEKHLQCCQALINNLKRSWPRT